MKKPIRFIFFAFLVMLLLAATLVVASATERQVSTQAELESAVSSVANGDVIVVTANMSLSSDIALNVNKTYTLCGSTPSVTVTFTSGGFVVSAGNVTIKDIRIVANASNAVKIAAAAATVTVGEAGGANANTYIESEGSVAGNSKSATGCAFFLTYGKLTIKSGTFYGSNRAVWQCTLIIDGGDFYQNKTLVQAEDKYAHIWATNSDGGTLTINGGTFTRDSNAPYECAALLLDSGSAKSNVTIKGGTFKNMTRGVLIDRCNMLTISGGTFTSVATDAGNCALICYHKQTEGAVSGTVKVTGGTFIGSVENSTSALVYANAGKFIFSGGTFTTKGNTMFDIALQKAAGDSFEISGGTYILDQASAGGVILRTTVGVSNEVNNGFDADPTKVFYWSDVDIKLTGGTFVDRRATPSPLIDANASDSLVILGDAVLLSRYAKGYFVDVNDAVGTDIAFAQNTVTVLYNGSNYYCYRAYEQGGSTTYSPEMEAGANVTITDDYDGIRFASYIPASVVSALSGKAYTFGTLIAPADYVVVAGGFTHAKMDQLKTTANLSITYVDIAAKNSIQQKPDGSISFAGTLIHLKSYTRDYAAVSYVKVGSTYYYSTYDVTENARTMERVAKSAYTTVVEEGYPSLYRTGAFSEYSTTEQQRLRTYSGYAEETVSISVTPSTEVTFDSGLTTNLRERATELVEMLGGRGYTSAGTPIFVGSKGTRAKKALERVDGYGYYIGVIDDAIVIAGSNNALTMQAVDVFEDLCAAGGAIQLTEIIASDARMIALNTETPFVYSHTRDENVANIYLREALEAKDYSTINFNYLKDIHEFYDHLYNFDENDETRVDYPLFAALQIAQSLGGSAFDRTYVSDSFNIKGAAIHIGLTDVARKILFAAGKDVGYYGYFIKDGNLVITSYDDSTLRLAKALFLEDLADYALDVNGDGTADVYAYPADYDFERGYNDGFTGAFDKVSNATGSNNVAAEVRRLVTDFPRPTNLELSGAVNVSNGELELYYLNATAADYESYCEKLAPDGYTVYMAEREVEGSYFVTYVNESKGIMLHIMYTAYAHASLQKLGDNNTLDAMFVPTLRIISSKTTDDKVSYMHHILPDKFLTKQAYTKRTDSKLTLIQLTEAGGFIYTLEDGSFVVIDGGKNNATDADSLYNVLTALHTEIYGSAPSYANPIRIAAWYLTHPHSDHYGLLLNLQNNYVKKQSDIVVEALIGNFPSNDEVYNAPSVDQRIMNLMGTYKWWVTRLNGDPLPFYNVHTGQNFFVGNLEFEVLFTPEDMHPWSMQAYNNACTVARLTVHAHDVAIGGTVNSSTVATSKTSCIALGDIYSRSARVLRATYGDYLESDMMTVGHHGTGNGGEGELYKMINPQIILWPNTMSTVKSNTNNQNSRDNIENREMLFGTRWRYILTNRAIASAISNYGDYNPTITFTKDGVPGLGAASTAAEIRSEAQEFVAALENVASDAPISYGTGYYVGEDFSKKDTSIESYRNGNCVLWRGNYFSDVTFPTRPAYPEQPEDPTPNTPQQSGMDTAPDTFGAAIKVVYS